MPFRNLYGRMDVALAVSRPGKAKRRAAAKRARAARKTNRR